jgi:hypothetical protein
MKVRPTGVIPPMTTPFTRDGEVDLKLVAPQVDWLIGAGSHQGLPKTFSRAPMPEASPAQQPAIRTALEGLGALGGSRVEAEE